MSGVLKTSTERNSQEPSAGVRLEPCAFDDALASPELKALVEELARLPLPERGLDCSTEQAERIRTQIEPLTPMTASGRAESCVLPGATGGVPVRIFLPRGAVRGAMLHMHGGGWVTGRPQMNDLANERLSDRHGLAIVSVDYRRAPEHPYPAAPDDCESVARWLARNACSALGAPADRILVGGESAGAQLAVVTALRMRDRHGFAFRAAILTYGLYDLSGLPSHHDFEVRPVMLDSAAIDWFTRCFVPDPQRRRDPDISPLYANLSGLAPALFTVGTLDPLLDDSLFLCARWVAAGNPAELALFPGAPHGFHGYPVPEGRAARRRIDAFLSRQLETG